MNAAQVLPVMLGWLPLAMLVTAVGGDSTGAARAVAQNPDRSVRPLDAYIDGRLTTAFLLSEELSPYPIRVQVRDGQVLLEGQVATRVQRDLALEIARSIDEVDGVNARIDVNAALPEEPARDSDSFAQRVQDAGITARIKTRLLWHASTRGLAIDVRTQDHVVTLSGTVESHAEGILAQLIAANTRGVRRVMNRLQIGDDALQGSVARGGTG